MRRYLHWRTLVLLSCVVFALQLSLVAQTPVKRPLSYDTYDYWRSIQGTKLSRDGAWLAYALTSEGDDSDLVVRNLKSGAEYHAPRGTNPVITPDGKFVVFTVAPAKADVEKAKKEKKRPEDQPKAGAGIMSLADGKITTVDKIGAIRIPDESSTWVAMHRLKEGAAAGNGRGGAGRAGGRGGAGGGRAGAAAPAAEPAAAEADPNAPKEKKKDPGTDLILHNLATGQETTIAEVSDFSWNRDGSWLAYAVSSDKAENDGAFARQMSDGSVHPLHKGKGHYKSLVFDDAGRQLAFLSDQPDYDKKVSPYRMYYWKGGDPAATELVSAATKGVPAGMVVSENGAPRFSKDGARLFVGTAPPPRPEPDADAPAPTKVDLWSYKDPLIQPMQKLRVEQERTRNYRGVVHLADKRFVQLGSPDLPTISVTDDAVRLMGTSDVPYQQEISWDATYNDVYLVDVRNGVRKKILEHWQTASLSPGGGYVLYFDEDKGHWYSYRAADGTRIDLTGALPVKFAQEDHDTPDLPPSYGSAGWTDADKSVLLYDQFDIWEIRPDGTGARMVTAGEGRKQHVQFRYRSLDPEERTVSSSHPLLLSAVNEDTRASGFYRVNLTGTAAPEKLLMLDKAVGAVTKAKNADTIVFTESRFEEFPDLWVSDTNLAAPKKVSNANPQQAQYNWGTSELISYVNGDGVTLQAVLTKPENFDPSKKYPLMVYIYEKLSNTVHAYHPPAPGGSSINITRYASNGYVVLQPDIIYKTGYPGQSALKCVVPAVKRVEDMGFIDPKRIAIQGHSWGGYQITYMITQTNIFRAVEAGASVSDMVSAYGGIRWGSGMVREFQYEKTQSRIGAPPWDAPLQYIENSAIFWVPKVQTPYLTMANDEDDAVPWQQGIEFYTALRRLGKEAYMFVFNGEKHGLRERDNQKYWTVHMDEYFDYFLLGKPKPSWMETGVPYIERGQRDVSPLFKKAVNTPAPNGKGR